MDRESRDRSVEDYRLCVVVAQSDKIPKAFKVFPHHSVTLSGEPKVLNKGFKIKDGNGLLLILGIDRDD